MDEFGAPGRLASGDVLPADDPLEQMDEQCLHCGREVRAGVPVCPHCGARTSDDEDRDERTAIEEARLDSSNTQTRRVMLTLIAAGVVLALAAAGLYWVVLKLFRLLTGS